jgi:hypothetical protein
MVTTAFPKSWAVYLVIITVDFTGAIPISSASHVPLNHRLIGVLLDIVHVDDVVHNGVVDDGGVSDRSGAIVDIPPARAIADVVAR